MKADGSLAEPEDLQKAYRRSESFPARLAKAAQDWASRPVVAPEPPSGTSRVPEAWAKLQKAAEDLQVTNPTLSQAQAVTKAAHAAPELADAYRAAMAEARRRC